MPLIQENLIEEYSKFNNYRWQSFITWDYLVFNLIKNNPKKILEDIGAEKWKIMIDNYMKRLQNG